MDNGRQDIETRAYEIWEAEGRPHGRDQDHWQRAEQDIAERSGAISLADDETDRMVAASSPAPAALPATKKRSVGSRKKTRKS